ncbi:MAG: hypothetical protein A2020_07710 [Lentisphaerae bacterium GWF2_45_14]|nr:MAG: hypothetical protein A2020_07710 [Lentisphaerae bacterium GWF2_45_14]
MASLNKVFLMGNLTREPALRFTPGGAAVCEFGLAVNRRFTSANGQEKKEEVCFVEIIVWGKQAEQCDRSLEKGAPVFIEGRLQYDQWEERDSGAKRSRLRVLAERVQFISGKPGRDQNQGDDQGDSYSHGGGDYGGEERSQRYQGGQQRYQSGGQQNSSRGGEQQQRPFPSDAPRQERQRPQNEEPPRVPEEAFKDDEAEDDIPF